MGLFLAPTSGNAVGRGYSSDPPPPGNDVDNVNRVPLRLLKKTMGKHKVKRLKIVPPGRMRGEIAPPYAWDGIERDDWKYRTPKPKDLDEGEFKTSPTLQSRSSLGKDYRKGPKLGGPPNIATPKPANPHPAPPHPATPKATDPRHARVDAITKELEALRAHVVSLDQQAKQLTQAGKSELQQRQKYEPGAGHTIAIGNPGKSKYLTLRNDPSRTESDNYPWEGVPIKDRRKNPRQEFVSPMSVVKGRRQSSSDIAGLQRHHDSGEARRQFATAPKDSGRLASIHLQINQTHKKIAMLVDELKKERMRMKQTHESYRLTSNNLRRLSLLLK